LADFYGTDVPFNRELGLIPVSFSNGQAVVRLLLKARHDGNPGVAHGGVLMTMLDATIGGAVRSLYPPGASFITVDLHCQFISAGTGTLLATGKVTRSGKTLTFADGEVRREADDGLVAKATGVFMRHMPSSVTA
jgi:uncharacterized protein (TIGR00369 family)